MSGKQELQILIVRRCEELGAFRENLRILLDRVDSAPSSTVTAFFQDVDWVESWIRNFAPERRDFVPYLVLIFCDQKIVGWVPLCLETRKFFGRSRRVLSFVGAENLVSDYCDALLDPTIDMEEACAAVWGAISADSSWHLFDWVNAPEGSRFKKASVRFFGQLRRERQAVLWARHSHSVICPRIDISALTESDRAKLHTKTSMKRKRKALEVVGSLEFKTLKTVSEVESHLELFFDQHAKRWDQRNEDSAFRNSAHRRFFRDLAKELFPRKKLRFSCLLLNQRAIAYHFGFASGHYYLWYKPAFDVDYADYSPGEVMLSGILKECVETDVNVFDFTVGSEAFKFRYANRVEKVERWLIGRSQLDRAFFGFRRSLSRLKTILRRSS